jgi:hypothetical protein
MWNGGYSQHRFSVKDIVACASNLQFVFGTSHYGNLLVLDFLKYKDFLVLFVFELATAVK